MTEFYDYLSGLTPDLPAERPEAAAESEKSVLRQMGIRKHPRITKRFRIFAVAAAAAIAVCGTVAAVSGSPRYNKQFAKAQFGELGTAKLETMVKLEPKTYTNGMVNATVEAVLCDGSRALLLTTFAPAERGQTIDWEDELDFSCEKGVVNSDGEDAYKNAWVDTQHVQLSGDQAWVTYEIQILPDGDPGATEATFVFKHWTEEYSVPHGSRSDSDNYSDPEHDGKGNVRGEHNAFTDGLEITFPIVQNIPVVTLRADNGDTVQLSGFELFRDTAFPFSDIGTVRLLRTDGSESTVRIPTYSDRMTGGTMSGQTFHFVNARFYETIDGIDFNPRKPKSFVGFIDVRTVSGAEIAGVTYRRVTE